MKYLDKVNGDLYVCKNIATSDRHIVTIRHKVNEQELIENEEFEKLIELQKMKHFSMQSALKFWDNFDYSLYIKILKSKKK